MRKILLASCIGAALAADAAMAAPSTRVVETSQPLPPEPRLADFGNRRERRALQRRMRQRNQGRRP